jgi:serine/threonine-protein kinase HipA
MRVLDVYINESLVGALRERDDIWSFTYSASWLKHGKYPLCPDMPLQVDERIDGSTKRYIQWFFDNLLPEEGARALLAKDLKEDEGDSFGILARVGAESAGALTLVEHGSDLKEGTAQALSFRTLDARIRALPRSPLNNEKHKRMSIAGAQHKMLIIKSGDEFYEPGGAMPSSHILKPEHSEPDDYWQTVRNEWFVMTLARQMGLIVPPVSVYYFPAPAYVIERFDRQGEFPKQFRIHAMDSCQTLGFSRVNKYGLSNVHNLKKFADNLRTVGLAKISILRWAIFNAIVGNTDAHLKNLTCLVSASGLSLSPMYDLVSTAIYSEPGHHLDCELSQKMGKANTLGELTRDDVVDFGLGLGLPEMLTIKELNKMLGSVEDKAEVLYQEVEVLPGVTNRAGELRMLRQIKVLMIEEMVARLRE